jgi:hypothetical protein
VKVFAVEVMVSEPVFCFVKPVAPPIAFEPVSV